MAVIDCPECGTQVSENEEMCPKCSKPIAGTSDDTPGGQTQNVEQKAKNYIRHQFLAAALTLISFMFVVYRLSANDSGPSVYYGAAGLIVGSCWYLIARFAKGKGSKVSNRS